MILASGVLREERLGETSESPPPTSIISNSGMHKDRYQLAQTVRDIFN